MALQEQCKLVHPMDERRYERLLLCDSHTSRIACDKNAASLLERRQQRHIKAINKEREKRKRERKKKKKKKKTRRKTDFNRRKTRSDTGKHPSFWFLVWQSPPLPLAPTPLIVLVIAVSAVWFFQLSSPFLSFRSAKSCLCTLFVAWFWFLHFTFPWFARSPVTN